MNKNKLISLFLSGVMCTSLLVGCGSSDDENNSEDGGNWAVYVYMCGSDLESEQASATNNLAQLCDSTFGEETKIIIETGGTSEWQNDIVSADVIQRWTVEDGEIVLVDETKQANMGEAETLQSFLEFASENYPSEHTMLIMWDHGGGTLGGCCIDENYDDDYLTLTEMHEAFENAYDLSEGKPLDILGFDACLMATIDVADTFKDCASYLLASEETEPGAGWDYQAFADSLGKNPTQSAVEFGKTICDTYLAALAEDEEDASATLSLTDLSKIEPLVENFETFANEMLVNACNDPQYYQAYAVNANDAENYGGNDRVGFRADMTDIKSFAQLSSQDIESSEDVISALEDCIVYKVNGPYRPESGGLSFFYNYFGEQEKNELYKEEGTIQALRTLYDIGVTGKVDKEEKEILKELDIDSKNLPEVKTYDTLDLEKPELKINKKGQIYADFGKEMAQSTRNVSYNIYQYTNDEILYLGTDDDSLEFDTETGRVTKTENTGNWAYVNDILTFMDLTYSCSYYNIYSIPIYVYSEGEKERANLQFVFDYATNEWYDMGYVMESAQQIAFSSRTYYLDDGEEFILIDKYIDDEGNVVEREGKTTKYSDEGVFIFNALPDGEYGFEFLMEDIYGNYFWSGFKNFTVTDGIVTYSKD